MVIQGRFENIRKFVNWSIDADKADLKSKYHKLIWTFDQEKIYKENLPEESLGC